MSKRRAEQIAQVILEEFNNYLIKEAEPPRNTLATITRAEVTDDLEHVYLFLSILPIDKTGTVMDFLKRNIYGAKKYLVKHTSIRKIPEIHLKIDDSAIKYRKIEREIEKIHEEDSQFVD